MNRDLFFIFASLLAFVAAILTIVDRSMSLRERFRSGKKGTEVAKLPEERPAPGSSGLKTLSTRFPWTRNSPLSYLFYREILVIGAAGLLLNYLGLALSVRLETILFLDMMGTALVAFLLGPWWGAVVALLSSSAVNWLLYPGPGADYLIFPWSLVNMTGAFFWGAVARSASFQRYLTLGHTSLMAHLWFLVRLGVLGGVVMSVPGTFVQAAIAEQTEVVLQTTVVRALQSLVSGWHSELQGYLVPILGAAWADSLGWAIVNWLQNCLRYIPDKTVSVAIALVVLKYGFPLFEKELIQGGPSGQRPRDSLFAPLALGLLYIPSFITLLSGETFSAARYWPLWSTPWMVIAVGIFVLFLRRQPKGEVREARLSRSDRYHNALKPIEQEPSYQFCRRLILATLIASALVAICLPILMADYGSVAFHFFCVVYGFLLALHLVHISISQNLSMARTGGFTTVVLPFQTPQGEKPRSRRSAR